MKQLSNLLLFIFMSCSLLQAKDYHVSKNGNDTNNGSKESPFKTINKAANVAQAGDVITVHEGVYRERVNPSRGGSSMNNPIVYQAATNEKVQIKGSEIIKGWEKLDSKTWVAKIPNDLFGDFNPYNDTIYGDWLERGQWSHSGEVYINNVALSEVEKLENVFSNKSNKASWYGHVAEEETWIWANFDKDPNKETVEINVRQSVFYPEVPYINYITVRGFEMSQAATPWAPPTAEQIGIIGTHWSKGWIIENNIIQHSKCVGITLGKYGDEWDNKAESEEGFVKTTERAVQNNWNREHVGSHLVRNNTISDCGQAGIVGSLGAIFSTVENNTIFDISQNQPFWGYELAGIKFHAPVDMIIKNNHIYRTEGGIWLDWMTQGTRITGNLLHDNRVQDFSLEVNHGPILVDNNIFLSEELAQVKLSQGVAFINNIIGWKIWPTGKSDERETPFLTPHGTEIAGRHDCPYGDVTFLNNIFTRIDLSVYDDCELPVEMKGNIFLQEAIPSTLEKSPLVFSNYAPNIEVIEEGSDWYLQMNVSKEWRANRKIVSTKDLRDAFIPKQSFNKENGDAIILDKDYLGNKRKQRNAYPGAIEFKDSGVVKTKVFSKR